MARVFVHAGARGSQGPAPLHIMQSLGRRVLSAAGPVSNENEIQGESSFAIKVGVMIAAVFITMVVFLSMCEKREKIQAYFAHEKAKVEPVPEGVDFEDLQEARPVPGTSAAQNRDPDQDE